MACKPTCLRLAWWWKDIMKSPSLWYLSKKWVACLSVLCVQSAFQCSRLKTRRAGRKVWNHFESEKGWHREFHFPCRSMVEMLNIRSTSRLYYFGGEPHFSIDYRISQHALRQWQIGGGTGAGNPALGSWVFAVGWNWARWAKTTRWQRRAGSASLRISVRIREMAQI